MARDYKNSGRNQKAAGAKRAPAAATGKGQLLLGLGIGLVIALGVHFYHSGKVRVVMPSERPDPPAAATAGKATAPAAQPGDDRPRFEFYKLLPEMEVVVPEEEKSQVRSQPPAPQRSTQAPRAPASTPVAPVTTRYLLQVGSFRSFGDADRLKAELALMGFEASIQSAEVRNGETWHRVRVGPFNEDKEASSVRQRLESNGVQALLLKVGS